jgi:hypothetical protein
MWNGDIVGDIAGFLQALQALAIPLTLRGQVGQALAVLDAQRKLLERRGQWTPAHAMRFHLSRGFVLSTQLDPDPAHFVRTPEAEAQLRQCAEEYEALLGLGLVASQTESPSLAAAMEAGRGGSGSGASGYATLPGGIGLQFSKAAREISFQPYNYCIFLCSLYGPERLNDFDKFEKYCQLVRSLQQL